MTPEFVPYDFKWRLHHSIPFVIILYIILLFRKRYPLNNWNLSDETLTMTQCNTSSAHPSVPFFVSLNSSSVFKDSVHVLDQYQTDVNRIITSLTTSYHEAIRTEQILFDQKGQNYKYRLSSAIESRISHIAQILEYDKFILEKLLRPFPITFGLPSPDDEEFSVICDDLRVHLHPPSHVDLPNDHPAYDSGAQIIAHITRDWTTLGRPIRKSLYEFCILQLLIHRKGNGGSNVLVPGAGLGRLTKDIFDLGFHVEGNEISTTMASAAFHLLHGLVEGVIHPFAFDFLMNEVVSRDRYEEIPFPDHEMVYSTHIITNESSQPLGSLSYTVGDFIKTYSPKRRSNTFDAVVTCFFIDTASNVYEYILVVHHVLKDARGIWINVGPLQWHANSKLRPAADELRLIIEAMGFSIVHWGVDKETMSYRNDDEVRYTKYEGYKPLRFVAIKK